MWQYFGTKLNKARFYPRPLYDTIIEPFAGAAGYSLRHWKKDIVLADADDQIIRTWRYLQQATAEDLLSIIPRLIAATADPSSEIGYRNIGERLFVGYIAYSGASHPQNRSTNELNIKKHMIAHIRKVSNRLQHIRHWKLINGDYHAIANIEATWFIDPPYQHGGEFYRCNNKGFDYAELADWCKSRRGQVIVCENTQADWMHFHSMGSQVRSQNKFNIKKRPAQQEAIWSNRPTVYDAIQEKLF